MGQLRKRVKDLSCRVRNGDLDAAQELFTHSMQMGHGKLAVRRLMLAHAMGVKIQADHARYCAGILASLPPSTAEKMAEQAQHDANVFLGKGVASG